jgi:hypothetical protein
MSRIVHLDNGSAIKSDVIECFDLAVKDEFNTRNGVGTTDFWNFVESDMYMGLRMFYNSEYIDACFEKLADEFDLDVAYDRLQVLKTDYLGMEA